MDVIWSLRMKLSAVPSRTAISPWGVFDVYKQDVFPLKPVRYIVGNFIKVPIKAVRADNPLPCFSAEALSRRSASSCSAHAVIQFQPGPPCQQQTFLPGSGCLAGFLLLLFLPLGNVCLSTCVFLTKVERLEQDLLLWKCFSAIFSPVF